jgi:hypothetical protein
MMISIFLQPDFSMADRSRAVSNHSGITQIGRILVLWIVILLIFPIGLDQFGDEDPIRQNMITDFQIDFPQGFFYDLCSDLSYNEYRKWRISACEWNDELIVPIARRSFLWFLNRLISLFLLLLSLLANFHFDRRGAPGFI